MKNPKLNAAPALAHSQSPSILPSELLLVRVLAVLSQRLKPNNKPWRSSPIPLRVVYRTMCAAVLGTIVILGRKCAALFCSRSAVVKGWSTSGPVASLDVCWWFGCPHSRTSTLQRRQGVAVRMNISAVFQAVLDNMPGKNSSWSWGMKSMNESTFLIGSM